MAKVIGAILGLESKHRKYGYTVGKTYNHTTHKQKWHTYLSAKKAKTAYETGGVNLNETKK